MFLSSHHIKAHFITIKPKTSHPPFWIEDFDVDEKSLTIFTGYSNSKWESEKIFIDYDVVDQRTGQVVEVRQTLTKSFKDQGLCPKCGDNGQWRAMACFCPTHGKFLG